MNLKKCNFSAFLILAVFLISIFPFRIFCHSSYSSHNSNILSVYNANEHSDCPICNTHFITEYDYTQNDILSENTYNLAEYNSYKPTFYIVFAVNSSNKSPPFQIF